MDAWKARVRVGTQTLDVTVERSGRLRPVALDIIRSLEIDEGRTVMITPTGPTVPLAADDALATIEWMTEDFEVVSFVDPSWPTDPRVELPPGAVG